MIERSKAYKHSLKILGAYDADKSVGIIRVAGEEYSMAYIQNIIVLTECRLKYACILIFWCLNDARQREKAVAKISKLC